jgi:electron transfer flavoprotein alpha subunit
MSILAVMEQRGGAWNRVSWETLAAAQQLGEELGRGVMAAVAGAEVAELAAELGKQRLERAYAVDHPLLRDYTADGYTAALRQLIHAAKPFLVLFPHTYQVRDFGPKLAATAGKVMVSDAIGHRVEKDELVLVRQLFQGKIYSDLRLRGDPPHFASLQAGSYRADRAQAGSAPLETFRPGIEPGQIRIRPLELFREAERTVDLGSAERIVSVGRGIREADNLPLVQKLADALGAELAASRPICDSGWLPMERQVGSSGQTVAPKLYVAIGISGAIQHLVGMKGSKTIVAINKDAEAPIFEVADYGIVGDLFQVVPALLEELEKRK